jgi:hypothetical protein
MISALLASCLDVGCPSIYFESDGNIDCFSVELSRNFSVLGIADNTNANAGHVGVQNCSNLLSAVNRGAGQKLDREKFIAAKSIAAKNA